MTITDIFSDQRVNTLVAGRTSDDKTATSSFLLQHQNRLIIRLNQTHQNNCLVLKQTAELSTVDLTASADALLTDRSDVVLTVRTADCLPILLFHPIGVIGVVHAGRKGTEAGILKHALLSLKAGWGDSISPQQKLKIWFGPAICNSCYQVNRDPDIRYDLRAKNTQQCEGILPNDSFQIMNSEHCTFHDNQDWYSYRREGAAVAMNMSYIALT